MKLRLPSLNLPLAAVTAATAAVAFAGGVMWTHSAGTADAAAATGKGWLGITIAPANDQQVATRLSITAQDGLAVVMVAAGGPADQAGVKQADVIKAVDGTTITDMKSADGLRKVQSGQTVALSISRAGQNLSVSVTAGDAPAGGPQHGSMPGGHGKGGFGGFGFGLPRLPELQGIDPGQLFDHILGGSFNLKDANNNPLTITVVAGKVVSASDTSITIARNDGTGNATFVITASTQLRGKGSELAAGDPVVVTTKNGTTDAVSIATPGKAHARPQPSSADPGQSGHSGPHRGPGRGQGQAAIQQPAA